MTKCDVMWCDQVIWVETRKYWFWETSNQRDNFLCFLLFWNTFNCLYLWNHTKPILIGFSAQCVINNDSGGTRNFWGSKNQKNCQKWLILAIFSSDGGKVRGRASDGGQMPPCPTWCRRWLMMLCTYNWVIKKCKFYICIGLTSWLNLIDCITNVFFFQ